MPKPILAALLSCRGYQLTDFEKNIFNNSNPLGITLFARNIQNKQQLRILIKEIKETIGRDDVLIAIDQEGGRVRRLKEPEFISYSSQTNIGNLPSNTAKSAAKLHAELISSDLRELDINVNFAPVLDICYPQTTEALRSRCFSSDVSIISSLGQITIETYKKYGILPCIKHMPGHGLASMDPHLGLPVINISEQQLQTEIFPFKNCNSAPLGMTAHILLPSIDANNPLTQSAIGIKTLIREQIGFQGLLISDSIDMKALKGNIIDKTNLSIQAGCDCICYCMAKENELTDLAENCPKLSDAALERLDNAIQILHNAKRVSRVQTKAHKYKTLIGNTLPYKETYDATEVLHQLS